MIRNQFGYFNLNLISITIKLLAAMYPPINELKICEKIAFNNSPLKRAESYSVAKPNLMAGEALSKI